MLSRDHFLQRLTRKFFTLGSSIPRRRRVCRLGDPLPELLESRVLLAGNVTAGLVDGNLTITGDADDNNVEVVVTGEGVVVRGLDGTTVNGSADDAVMIPGEDAIAGSLTANLGDGNDRIQIEGVDIRRRTTISGGNGDDEIGLTSLSARRKVELHGGTGNDTIVVNNVESRREVKVTGGEGDDLVVVNGLSTRRKLAIVTGSGDDNVSIADSSARRKTKLRLGSGDDTAAITGSSLGRRLRIVGGNGDDLVQIENSTVRRISRLLGRRGDDSFLISGTTDLGRFSIRRGGRGEDAFEVEETVAGSKHTIERNFESDVVEPTLIEERLDDETEGLFAMVDAVLESFPTGNDTLEISIASPVTESSGVVIVNDETLEFNVVGQAGLVIEIDVDGDGEFDDGTATLDDQGMATVQTTLIHDDTNLGLNDVRVRGVEDGVPLASDPQEFDVHFAIGTVMRFTSDLGVIDVELLDDDAPITVQNFLGYDARLDGSIIHRSARSGGNDFIIQGGAFDLVPPLTEIVTDPAIQNEFDANNSNVRGTLSMALPANSPNDGTSQWFFNVADNSFLDAALHTVFGRVIGDGMEVVDAIHALDTFNLITSFDDGALGEVPLESFTEFTEALTGTVETTSADPNVTGTGTAFLTELTVGGVVEIDGVEYTIGQITSDTEIVLTENALSTLSVATVFVNAEPADADFVQFSSIDVLLAAP